MLAQATQHIDYRIILLEEYIQYITVFISITVLIGLDVLRIWQLMLDINPCFFFGFFVQHCRDTKLKAQTHIPRTDGEAKRSAWRSKLMW